MNICMYICIHTYTAARSSNIYILYECIYICIYVYIHTYIHTYIHIYRYEYTDI